MGGVGRREGGGGAIKSERRGAAPAVVYFKGDNVDQLNALHRLGAVFETDNSF